MAIKTKEEIFGDDGANGTQVPIDLTNPSGTAAANRGCGFGESVTSAIANRTTYALAENDEDLDARIVDIETDGLDSVYDLGLTDDAGAGRTITKDGGAVETVSALATDYADDKANAHFRANAVGDTKGGSVGFDALSARTARGTGAAGVLDRRVYTYDFAAQGTLLTASEALLLNPAGAAPTSIRLTSGSFFWQDGTALGLDAGARSQLLLGVDMVEITIAGVTALYIITALGATEEDVQVRSITGDSPSFGASAAASAVFFRPVLSSWGTDTGAGRSEAQGTTLVGDSRQAPTASAPALNLISSSTDALISKWKGESGTLQTGIRIDRFGRLISVLRSTQLEPSTDEPYYTPGPSEGAYLTYSDKTGNTAGAGDVSHVVLSGDDNTTERNDFLSLEPVVVAGLNIGIAMAFTVTSVTAGEALLNLSAATVLTGFTEYMPEGVMFALIGSSSHSGIYRVSATQDTSVSGSPLVTVASLSGQDVSFVALEAGTITFLRPTQIGRVSDVPFLAIELAAAQTTTAGAVIVAPADGTGLLVVGHHNTDRRETALIRALKTIDGDLGGALEEIFRVSGDGQVHAATFVSENFHLAIEGRNRPMILPAGAWRPDTGTAWAQSPATGRWSTTVPGERIYMDISEYLPPTVFLEEIILILSSGTYDGFNGVLTINSRVPDFSSPAGFPSESAAGNSLDATSAAVQALTIDSGVTRTTGMMLTLEYYSGDLTAGSDEIGDVEINYETTQVGW